MQFSPAQVRDSELSSCISDVSPFPRELAKKTRRKRRHLHASDKTSSCTRSIIAANAHAAAQEHVGNIQPLRSGVEITL